jgi:hypothetical protein
MMRFFFRHNYLEAKKMIQQGTPFESKTCCQCLQCRPLTQFRRVRKGQDARRTDCNQCHRENEEARKLRHRGKQQGMMIQKSSAAICQSNDPQRIGRIAEGLLDEFGGWDRFARVWREIFEDAQKNKRHRRVFHMLQSIWKLQQAAEELAVESRRVEINRASFELSVAKSPTVAAGVLTQLGWDVTPPARSD